MTNLLKCKTCTKIVTSEEANLHKCEVPIRHYKTFFASSYFTVKDKNEDEYIVIDGLDGIGYRFIVSL